MSSDKLQEKASVLLGMFEVREVRSQEARLYDAENQTLTHRDGALMSPNKHNQEN